MKSIFNCFSQMLRQMKQDTMLIIIAFVPFLAGTVFRFIIPVIEDLITGYFGVSKILTTYYELFDLFLIILTPSMLNYVVAMVILEETDDRVISYLAVTPLGKAGYLFSRLGVASLVSFPVSIFVSVFFRLTETNILMLTGIALAGTIQGIVAALLIVTLSTNKVEGMAVGKMTSLFSLGAIVPYFISGKIQYILSALPSFWMAKSIQSGNYYALLISILLSVIWIAFLSEKFKRKIAI